MSRSNHKVDGRTLVATAAVLVSLGLLLLALPASIGSGANLPTENLETASTKSILAPAKHGISRPDVGARTGSSDKLSGRESRGWPDEAKTIMRRGAMLGILAGALDQEFHISVETLRPRDVPKLDGAMDNVTPTGEGYRLGPDGLKFKKPIILALPYDPALIPPGLRAQDIRTFYYDPISRHWVPLAHIRTDTAERMVYSTTDHFTDFINSTLTLPDHPEPDSYGPNRMTRVPPADPAAGIRLIDPPGANAMGDARLTFPIDVPPGRRGLTPRLGLSYSSSAGNSWCGWGWDLRASSIEVDTTRFGVPRYDPNNETETYRLDGAQLAPTANPFSPESRVADRIFVRRVEGAFHRIVRRGDAPHNYWWEVTDQNGTRFEYGKTAAARLQSYGSPTVIFRWLLERVIDTHGNTMEYRYTHDDIAGPGEPSTEVYLAGVDYTGKDGGSPARYHVDFILDDGSRADRSISGRPGFKVLRRHRLDRVDVRFDASLIRRYELSYLVGDFSKSLLESIAVIGEDGSTEFYRHTFDYFDMPTNPDSSYDGFGGEEVWGAVSAADTMAKLRGRSHHLSLFLGLGPADCEEHVGVTPGWGQGTTKTRRTLVDVNGDGLPDRIHKDGGVELNSLSANHESGGFSGSTFYPGTTTLEQDENEVFTLGAGLHFCEEKGLVWGELAWTHADQTKTVADMDGDGLVDLVSTDSSMVVRRNDGQQFLTGAAYGGYSLDGLDLSDPEEEADILADFHTLDPLLRWEAPYSGTVQITGVATKIAGGGDGLDVYIYKSDTQLWTEHIDAAGGSTADPAPLSTAVTAGDRIYFGLTSGNDTAHDAVSWEPRIKYTVASCAPGRNAVEPYGAKVCIFDHGDDFRLAAPPSQTWVAPAEGEVDIDGCVTKLSTSDDVRVEVQHNGTALWTKDYGANAKANCAAPDTFDMSNVAVAQGDTLAFVVTSDTPIDPGRVVLDPTVLYVEYCVEDLGGTLHCGDPSPCFPDPDEPSEIVCDFPGNPFAPIPLEVIEQSAPVQKPVFRLEGHTPTVAWVAASDGTVDVSGTVTKAVTSDEIILLVQGVNGQHGKITLSRAEILVGVSFDITGISVTARDRLFFTAYALDDTDDPSTDVTWSATVQYTSPPGAPTAATINNRVFAAPDNTDRFAGGYHGFTVGEWNGDQTFDESCFAAPAVYPPPGTCHTDFAGMEAARSGLAGVGGPLWAGHAGWTYIGSSEMRPSRLGGNPLGVVQGSGISVLQRTVGRNLSVAGDVCGVISGRWDDGTTRTRLSLLDLNGDRFPDQVTAGTVRLNNGVDGFVPVQSVNTGDSLVREIWNTTVAWTIGIGNIVNLITSDGFTRALASLIPAFGATYGTSNILTDLMDINGDGLPDRVTMDPGDGSFTVRLNLGYRFGAEDTWTLPTSGVTDLSCDSCGSCGDPNFFFFFPADAASSQTLRLNESAADLGTEASVSRTLVAFRDVNGDGLRDRVIKLNDEPFFRVTLNRGASFEAERLWSIPGWSGDVDPDTEDLFCGNDTLETSVTRQDGFNIGHEFKISITPPGICIVIGPNLNIGRSNTGAELVFTDIDGDGKPDHVLKRDGQAGVLVKRNQVGKTNLLREVVRPLGGSFTLDYIRQGNRVDESDPNAKITMPTNRWVVSEVNVDDGRGNSYLTQFEYFDDGYFDRAERQDYGLARIRETKPDGSTIDRHYYNQDFYRRSLPLTTVIADSAGMLFRKETIGLELRPVMTGAFFPATVTKSNFFYEGTTSDENDFGKITTEVLDYDAFGNPISFVQTGDVGTADDVEGTIDYHHNVAKHIIRPSHLRAADSSDTLLRENIATYNSSGDMIILERVLVGGKDPATGAPYDGTVNPTFTMTYDAFGNLATLTDPNSYTLTYAYDTDLSTHTAMITDSFGYSSTRTYDVRWATIATTTDANSQPSSSTYDQFGRLVEVFGPYDDAGSPGPSLSFEYHPEASPPFAVTHQKDVTRPDPISTVKFVNGLGREIQRKMDTELDSGGQIGMTVSGKIVFDAIGRIAQRGQPIFSTTPLTEFVTVPLQNPTNTTYDILNRILTVTLPDGSVTGSVYGFDDLDGTSRLITAVTDAESNTKRVFRSVRNELLAVEEKNTIGGTLETLVTRYGYNPLSELTNVTDALGNVTSAEYDTIGRRIRLEVPDTGVTEWRYDGAGNLGAKITANLAAQGQQVRYLYTFNRLDQIDYPEMQDVLYAYGLPGAPLNRAGRIVTVSNESGVEERFYGRLGETTRTVRTMSSHTPTPDGEIYDTQFTYDSFNRLLEIIYHDGEVLTYGFDAGGRINSVSGLKNAVPYDYVSHIGYDEFGTRARIIYGNGVVTLYDYDAETRRLTNLNSDEPGGLNFQNLHYTYDSVGNILQLDNDVPIPPPPTFGGPSQQSFTYDELYQLVDASGTYAYAPRKDSIYSVTMDYDEIGNITAKDQAHFITQPGGSGIPQMKTTYQFAYTYGGPQPHAATHIGERTYFYDLNGNQTGWDHDNNGTFRQIVWDEENRIKAVSDNGHTTEFLYDADAKRTHKVGPQGETIYVNQYYTVRNREITSKHIFVGNERVCTKMGRPALGPGGGPPGRPHGNGHPSELQQYFYHTNHLRSSTHITDQEGELFQHTEYFASGEIWVQEKSNTQRSPYLFGGQELDEETGLYAFSLRYYDPRPGRWLSADPLLTQNPGAGMNVLTSRPWLEVPGNWNPYGYSLNNPVVNVDPNGAFSFNAGEFFEAGVESLGLRGLVLFGQILATEAFGEGTGGTVFKVIVAALVVYEGIDAGLKASKSGRTDLESAGIGLVYVAGTHGPTILSGLLKEDYPDAARFLEFVPSLINLGEVVFQRDFITGRQLDDDQISQRLGSITGHVVGAAFDPLVREHVAQPVAEWLVDIFNSD